MVDRHSFETLRFSPSARQIHGVDADTVDVESIVAPEEAQGPGLQHVHIIHPGEFDSPDLADAADRAARMGHDHSHSRAVFQFHVTAAGRNNRLRSFCAKRRVSSERCTPRGRKLVGSTHARGQSVRKFTA